VTSTFHNGNFGGISGGDAFCQAAADAANLGGTGVWHAWLSDWRQDTNIRTHAKDRVDDVEYRLVDGKTVVASDKADLTDGTIQNHIKMTETGDRIEGQISVFTGTLKDGTVNPSTNCARWTIAPDDSCGRSCAGGVGSSVATNSAWTHEAANACKIKNAIYCFEVSQ
jgi:hypothetical protein